MHNEGLKERGKNIIILSEFMEGAWESVLFSYANFETSNHGVVFVQTYRKPKFGQSLLKNFVPVMRQIIKNELLELKFKTLNKFQIEESRVAIHPFEGDWFSFINIGQNALNPEVLVLSMKKAFPEASCQLSGKIHKLASHTTKPLFILPDLLSPTSFGRVLFLSGNEMRSFSKMDKCQSIHAMIRKSTMDFRLLIDGDNTPHKEVVEEQLHQKQLRLESLETFYTKDNPKIDQEALAYDLVIIDQELLKSPFREMINLKKWFENKNATPVLIC